MTAVCGSTGKVAYPTAVAAGRSLTKTQARGRPTRAYVCQFCKRWHLTTQPLKRPSSPAPKSGGSQPRETETSDA